MARWEPEQVVELSLLDRLIDLDPKNAKEASDDPDSKEPGDGRKRTIRRAQSVRQLKASLRRDLEWLLNTRRSPEAVDGRFQELERSLFNYGLPDMTSLSWDSDRDRVDLTRLIEELIAIFEPRLMQVRVTPIGTLSATQNVLRFQIEGLLDMSPAPERISFDAALQRSTGEYQVKGEPSAG